MNNQQLINQIETKLQEITKLIEFQEQDLIKNKSTLSNLTHQLNKIKTQINN